MNASKTDIFQAIADPTRRAILILLSHESMHLNAIADQFSISRPAISKHIKILTHCGLITIRKAGRMHYCEACFDQLQPIRNFISQFHTAQQSRVSNFDWYLQQLEETRKRKKNRSK